MSGKKTKHPCAGMTKAQRRTFEQIAINQKPSVRWQTLDALLNAGLIKRGKDDVYKDGMGVFTVPTFYVPLPIHAQWCEWCSENSEEEL